MALTADALPVTTPPPPVLLDRGVDPAATDLGWLDDLIADASEVTRRLAALDLGRSD